MKKGRSIPVLLIAGLLPIVFYFHVETIDFSQYPWFPNQGYWLDLFLYGKSRLLQIISLLMAGILLISGIKNRNKNIWNNKENILLPVMGILYIFSAFFSKYPKESFYGTIEQYESLGVLLGYLILCAYCIRCGEDRNTVELIWKALIFGLALSCVLGVLQLVQKDFWSSDFGKNLLIPEEMANLRESMRFSEDDNGFRRVYMSLYNPNYAGIYLVMLLPFVWLSEKKWVKLLGVLVVFCLLGTLSKTAWLAAGFVGILGIWMVFGKKIHQKVRKKYLITGIGITIASVVLIGILPTDDGVLKGKNKLQEVAAEENAVRIVYQGNTIYFSDYPQDEGVHYKIVDENENKILLSWIEERGELDPVDSKYEGLHFKVYLKDGISYAVFRYEDVFFRFTDDLGTGKYEYVSTNGKIDELQTAETFIDSGDSLLNGRGYIWNRVLPLIEKNFFLGTGPDTFMLVFPQDDYVARANLGYGFFSEILTNAHSLYLQIGLQTGMISLACFLVFVGIYLRRSWKIYAYKESYDYMDRVGIACFLGTVGYLICGLTFASSVCTTPIFMIIMGMGIGITNCSCKKNIV